jgi:hypothetical protein
MNMRNQQVNYGNTVPDSEHNDNHYHNNNKRFRLYGVFDNIQHERLVWCVGSLKAFGYKRSTLDG